MANLSGSVSPEIIEQLNALAKETGHSRNFHIERALLLYLQEYGDLEIALARKNNPGQRLLTLEELETDLGISSSVQGRSKKRLGKSGQKAERKNSVDND